MEIKQSILLNLLMGKCIFTPKTGLCLFTQHGRVFWHPHQSIGQDAWPTRPTRVNPPSKCSHRRSEITVHLPAPSAYRWEVPPVQVVFVACPPRVCLGPCQAPILRSLNPCILVLGSAAPPPPPPPPPTPPPPFPPPLPLPSVSS